jgi:CheY-like chemotaxis protein
MRVLLIDDDRDTTEAFGLYLRQKGLDVLIADNGPEGLRVAKAMRPNVIVLDVHMPVVDGCDVVKELRDDPDTTDIPIALFTGALGPDNTRDLCGADVVVEKPCPPERLLAVVRQLGESPRAA